MADMRTTEFLDLVAEAIEVDTSSLTWDTQIADVAEWTSLGWLSIMSLVDERYDVQLNAKTLRELKTIGELADYLGRTLN